MPRGRFRTALECDPVSSPYYQHPPFNGKNARRSHSSNRIIGAVSNYNLCSMPFVPYALTLSLGVAYRTWRLSRIPIFRPRSSDNFRKVLAILEKMGEVWTSAKIKAQLSQVVMRKLDQHLANLRRTVNPFLKQNSAIARSPGFSNGESSHDADGMSGVITSGTNLAQHLGPDHSKRKQAHCNKYEKVQVYLRQH